MPATNSITRSRSHRPNWAWPVVVRCTPSLNQRDCDPSELAAFQSRTRNWGHLAVAARKASL